MKKGPRDVDGMFLYIPLLFYITNEAFTTTTSLIFYFLSSSCSKEVNGP
jgi:hypothetical protein